MIDRRVVPMRATGGTPRVLASLSHSTSPEILYV
jgi:hypothetical protein